MAKNLQPAYVAMIKSALVNMDKLAVNFAELQDYFYGDNADVIRQSIIHPVAKHYNVAVIEGQRKAAGTYVLDKDSTNYETAKKQLQRLTAKIMEPSKAKAEPTPKKRIDLVAQVLKYIEGKKLTDKQLAKVKAAL